MRNQALPVVPVKINGAVLAGLVDSGCSATVISARCVKELGLSRSAESHIVRMLNGVAASCGGVDCVSIQVSQHTVHVSCLVADDLVGNVDVILGMDSIEDLGGVTLCRGSIRFGCDKVSGAVALVAVEEVATNVPIHVGRPRPITCNTGTEDVLEVCDQDFDARFDGKVWTVKWKWVDSEPVLTNQVSEYRVSASDRECYDTELRKWVEEGWLEPYDRVVHGQVDGVVPLMAASQPNKPTKVRPVMDYREVNKYVSSHPGMEAAVCGETLREWRRLGEFVSLLDLKKAYLQLHISSDLVRFQAVRHNGKMYVMTRMGFGLSVAPKVMAKVLGKVLSLDDHIRRGTSSYVDDIAVNESIVSVEDVRLHLKRYGLVTKEPVQLEGARVLGLHVERRNERLVWQRDNSLPSVGSSLTRRELFGVCGQLVGHYPVANWLRVACSYVKRRSGTGSWDSSVPECARTMMCEVVERVSKDDPVRGTWLVPAGVKGRIWSDASSIALGVCVEVGGASLRMLPGFVQRMMQLI